jgi:hypothetical protein
MAGLTPGRKPKLTADLEKRLLGMIRAGVPFDVACPGAGIASRTLRIWRERALAGEERYLQFIDKLEAARAEAHAGIVIQLRKASVSDWRAGAWLLERTNWKEFGIRAPVQEAGQQSGPLEIVIRRAGKTEAT